jgi:hypothetical protein
VNPVLGLHGLWLMRRGGDDVAVAHASSPRSPTC